ncbi:LPS assembly lipoprotein LptE [Aliiroseovarius sp. PTFE2010]|uniref:LPS assembly lipoprotein LptE n=1 Tax=Aliiroseovarius sp. PTFE2010 TaxID=3417190 RepID=UPI003CF577D1
MSSFNRRIVALSLLALGACGFTPAYGPTGSGAALRGAVTVAAPDDQASYALVRQLESRLGRPERPIYDLNYTIETQRRAVGITPEQETTRYHLTGTVTYVLSDRAGQTVHDGVVRSFTAYAATGSTTSTLTATRDAEERLMVILADRIVTRLVADLAR